MPELPEVEAVVRALRADGAEQARITKVTVHRPSSVLPQTPEQVSKRTRNQTIGAVERRGKNILIRLSNEQSIRVHLRMTGDLRIVKASAKAPLSTRVEWKLADGRRLLFTDSRALGKVHVHSAESLQAVFQKLGPEPLSRSFSEAWLRSASRKSRLPSKLFLMDQTKIAGLGNIYAAEALFRARISPFRPMNELTEAEINRMHGTIRKVLRDAIQSVYQAYRSPGGYRQHKDDFDRRVYGRAAKPCVMCRTPIQRVTQGGRSTYFCSHCQH